MLERDGYPAGVPCWVDTSQRDPEAAATFYGGLFGWDFEDRMPAEAPGSYFVARLRGRDVAAVGSQPAGAPATPAWSTYIWVDSAEETATKARAAGGEVLSEPFDVLDAGRMAVLADPSGAAFCVWQAGAHRGAQVVNEAGSWNWSDLNTRDMEAAKAFYGAVFGWEAMTVDFGQGEVAMWTRPHWSVTFSVDDADAIAARAAELGATVVTPPFDVGPTRVAVLRDPQGATFTVSRYQDRPRGPRASARG
jgi:predicted enzyme related to lactoylglutathione lyase